MSTLTTHRDIELPPTGPQEAVATAFPTIFTWDYEIRHEELMRLYEKGKKLQWNAATDIDWSIDVDPEREDIDANILSSVLAYPEPIDSAMRGRMNHHFNAWMLSQFLT